MKILRGLLICLGMSVGVANGQGIVESMEDLFKEPDLAMDSAIYTVEILPNKDDKGNVVKLGEKETIDFVKKVNSRFGNYAHTMLNIKAFADGEFSVIINGDDNFKSYVLKSLKTSGNIGFYELHAKGVNTEFSKRVYVGEEKAPGFKAYIQNIDEGDGKVYHHYYLLRDTPAVFNIDLEGAKAAQDQETAVDVILNQKGEAKMMAFTKRLKKGDVIATVIDDKLVSVASLQAPYLGKYFRIFGSGNLNENAAISGALMSPFEYQLRVTEVKK